MQNKVATGSFTLCKHSPLTDFTGVNPVLKVHFFFFCYLVELGCCSRIFQQTLTQLSSFLVPQVACTCGRLPKAVAMMRGPDFNLQCLKNKNKQKNKGWKGNWWKWKWAETLLHNTLSGARRLVRHLALRSAHLRWPRQSSHRKPAAFSHVTTLARSRAQKHSDWPAAWLGSGIQLKALGLHFFTTPYKTQANICALGSKQMKTSKFSPENCLLTRNAVKRELIRSDSTVPRSLQPRHAPCHCGQDAAKASSPPRFPRRRV